VRGILAAIAVVLLYVLLVAIVVWALRRGVAW
jgi:cbb3-type cytochrome oxidase subunit 3